MRLIRGIVLAGLVVSSTRFASADPIEIQELIDGKEHTILLGNAAAPQLEDPQIWVRRLRRGSIPFFGLTFTFDSTTGTGVFDFFNAAPATLYSLTFVVTPGGPPSDVSSLFACGVDSELSILPFNNCQFKQAGDTNSPTIVTFYGPPGLPGQSHFAININGFQPGTHVQATAAPVPEPGTVALCAAGIVLLFAGWLLRKLRSPELS